MRRAQCQELLEAARILEAYRIQGRRNHRLARNIADTAQITADWQLDEEMFLETRPLLAERDWIQLMRGRIGVFLMGPCDRGIAQAMVPS